MLVYLGVALVAAAGVLYAVAAVSYARELRGHYDAIAMSTLFDGRWIMASLILAGGGILAWRWAWWIAATVVLAAFVVILPVKWALHRAFGRY